MSNMQAKESEGELYYRMSSNVYGEALLFGKQLNED